MKKRDIILIASSAAMIAMTASVFALGSKTLPVRANLSYQITLNSTAGVAEMDGGNYHEAKVKENKIDMIGWSSEGGAFGSIRKKAYGSYQYNGMIYNRTHINGFTSLTVTFSGGDLFCVFSDFLMENMDFDGAQIESGVAVDVPAGKAYFIVYNTSEAPVNIENLNLSYTCDGSIDSTMIFNKETTLGGARSMSKTTVKDDSVIELENNPTSTTNNYSTGSHGGHSDKWYRWNGRYFSQSQDLGTDFEFGMTVIGNISQMIDGSANFHYGVWPQFDYGNSEDRPWMQSYIGNDNYEPLGHDNALNPSDPYTGESYAGRFFTNYIYDSSWPLESGWKFADPDITTVLNGTKTYREAFETYNLPFWFLKFKVYLDSSNEPICDIYINGFLISSEEIFYEYDTVNTPSISIYTMPLHVVNYGVDADGTPDDSYKGAFTYPRLIAH